jgi:adenylate cyclase
MALESRCSSQGYLSSHKERVVRVRIEGERAVMTIKGANKGATRGEWEYEIPVADAAELLDGLCEQPLIESIAAASLAGNVGSG